MKFLRLLLLPFSLLYGTITTIRNFLFDINILKSTQFEIPVIVVGNLSVGGTGKTPQTEYLIRLLSDYKVAVLSRGYKRKSTGFVLANNNSTADLLGDEPYQIHKKFPNIQVAVDANRVAGIQNLLQLPNAPQIVLLDDAYQHRKIKAGFYILLTAYNDLYCDDFVLPAGNLRECRTGAKRANCIIVTKCPKNISGNEQQKIINKIKLNVPIFFSCIDYDEFITNDNVSMAVTEIKETEKVLIAGIAKPKPFFDYLKNSTDEILEYADHHDFSTNEVELLKAKSITKLLVTTEKDFVRLQPFAIENLFYLPIKSKILNKQEDFNTLILNYVGKSTRNR